MNTYITGSDGFIGRHLAARIGDYIVIPHHWFSVWPIRHLQPDDRFFFLSTYGNMADHTDRREILKANVADVLTLLQRIMHLGCQFIFVSSSSVNLPVQTPYSRAKRAAEEIILASGLPACIVRPYTVTGRGEQPAHLIPRLIDSCLNGTSMDLVLDATHDYVDVEDVADGLIALANNHATGVFEFGNGEAISNAKVCSMVEEACGRMANVKAVTSMRAYDNADWHCASVEIDKALAAGWRPHKSLATSIREMVEARKPC